MQVDPLPDTIPAHLYAYQLPNEEEREAFEALTPNGNPNSVTVNGRADGTGAAAPDGAESPAHSESPAAGDESARRGPEVPAARRSPPPDTTAGMRACKRCTLHV